MLLPYQVNAELMKAAGNPGVKFLRCPPALRSTETEVGRQMHDKWVLPALEVTDEVLSPASIVFDQAENRLRLAASRGLPEPLAIVELPTIRALAGDGATVICRRVAASRCWRTTMATSTELGRASTRTSAQRPGRALPDGARPQAGDGALILTGSKLIPATGCGPWPGPAVRAFRAFRMPG